MTQRIAITMSHGYTPADTFQPMTADHFKTLVGVAGDMGFTSINYDQLKAWRDGQLQLPERVILFDFDHAVTSMLDVADVLADHGFKGNLFIHTGPMPRGGGEYTDQPQDGYMTWTQVRTLVERGWHIGAHTVTHPNLSKLFLDDPQGEKLAWELDTCNKVIETELGITPRDFAYTGTSFSTAAEKCVAARYRFGRLWITKSTYDVDGRTMRYGELVNVPGEDEPDGGPPVAARYITRESPAHRLPSMEMQRLIYPPAAFEKYLQGAITP